MLNITRESLGVCVMRLLVYILPIYVKKKIENVLFSCKSKTKIDNYIPINVNCADSVQGKDIRTCEKQIRLEVSRRGCVWRFILYDI